ncbi:MAG: hypothetical protein C0424_09035 [Sphingobacteriaceae bacterium]|nr:hypothetical protein [Sphingobacteriaceae bacterium]
MSESSFWEGFAPQSLADWEQAATKELKGAPLDKLRHRTPDGLELAPYYSAAERPAGVAHYLPGEYPYRRGLRTANNHWTATAYIAFNHPKEGNRQALHALNHGADALWFDGTLNSESDFLALVAGIAPQYIAMGFSGVDGLQLGNWLLGWTKQLAISPFALRGCLAYTPAQLPTDRRALADFYRQHFPTFNPFCLHTAHFREQGAGLVEETALALAAGHELLFSLVSAGLTPDEAAPLIQFQLALDTDYFAEMARLRAFRQAWSQVLVPYQPKHSCSHATTLHAVSGRQALFSLDRHTNLLRLTTMGMAAVAGGVQSLTLLPFDAPIQGGDDFSQELSLQIQLLLHHEAQLGQVVDPAAGAYFLENLSNQVGEKAWKLFQIIEAAGGFSTWQQSGALQQLLSEGAAQREKALASRKQIRVGVNQYPNAPESLADWNSNSIHNAFDRLRHRVATAKKQPRIFLLPLGDVAMRMARLNFSSNFLGCAGFELLSNSAFESPETGAAAALAAGADAVVLCSDDASWACAVPALGQILAGKTELILAGAPGESEADFRAAGFNTFIHLRANLLDTLEQLATKLLAR